MEGLSNMDRYFRSRALAAIEAFNNGEYEIADGICVELLLEPTLPPLWRAEMNFILGTNAESNMALHCAQEAVDLYRSMNETEPDEHCAERLRVAEESLEDAKIAEEERQAKEKTETEEAEDKAGNMANNNGDLEAGKLGDADTVADAGMIETSEGNESEDEEFKALESEAISCFSSPEASPRSQGKTGDDVDDFFDGFPTLGRPLATEPTLPPMPRSTSSGTLRPDSPAKRKYVSSSDPVQAPAHDKAAAAPAVPVNPRLSDIAQATSSVQASSLALRSSQTSLQTLSSDKRDTKRTRMAKGQDSDTTVILQDVSHETGHEDQAAGIEEDVTEADENDETMREE